MCKNSRYRSHVFEIYVSASLTQIKLLREEGRSSVWEMCSWFGCRKHGIPGQACRLFERYLFSVLHNRGNRHVCNVIIKFDIGFFILVSLFRRAINQTVINVHNVRVFLVKSTNADRSLITITQRQLLKLLFFRLIYSRTHLSRCRQAQICCLTDRRAILMKKSVKSPLLICRFKT